IHSTGIVHRDLKPGNILLAPGSPKVIDFGIAKALEATSHHTRTQETVGTLAYMAPERFAPEGGHDLTPAADIFAWGAVMAFAATGRNPFAADSPAAVAGRIMFQPPQLDGVPAALSGIIASALDKDPARRPTAQELLLELTGGAAAAPTAIVPASVLPPAARSRRRGIAAAAAATAVVLLVGAGAWAGARLGQARETPAVVLPSASGVDVAGPVLARQSAKELFDPLTSPSLWKPSGTAEEGCDFDGGLVVRAEFTTECENGPDQIFRGDVRIEVRAQMSLRSCTVIWFRLSEDGSNGYYASVCNREVGLFFLDGFLDHYDERSVRDGTMAALDVEENGSHLIAVNVRKNTAKVTVDGRTVLTSDLSRGESSGARHTSGKVTFGAIGDGGPAVTVTLRDAHVVMV
ncbi:MAG TPA: serine/threonine-protein kinase, partial [Actinoplanes sp.]|nr:serine/threonine-protein kinase [Actinoplanes sp.]